MAESFERGGCCRSPSKSLALLRRVDSWRTLRIPGGELGCGVRRDDSAVRRSICFCSSRSRGIRGVRRWMERLISTCGSAAVVSIVVGEFLVALLPADKSSNLGLWIAAGVSTLFAVLQWRSIAWGSTTQNLTSLVKALLFICLIGASSLSYRWWGFANDERDRNHHGR